MKSKSRNLIYDEDENGEDQFFIAPTGSFFLDMDSKYYTQALCSINVAHQGVFKWRPLFSA